MRYVESDSEGAGRAAMGAGWAMTEIQTPAVSEKHPERRRERHAEKHPLRHPVGHREKHPEWQLLLWAARPRVDARSIDAMRVLLAQGIDWELTLAMAEYHGVASLVDRALRKASLDAVPGDVVRRLHLARHATELQNRYLFRHLVRILSLCDAQGIPVVPVKGPLLAETVYGSMALRSTRDIDLLVRRVDVPGIRDLLVGKGFDLIKPAATFGTRSDDFERFHEMTFGLPSEGVYVETQWSISNDRFHSRLDLQKLWENLTSVRIQVANDGVAVSCLRREDLLVMLCEHATKHFWSRLKWTCDVAELVAEPVDWNAVFDRAGSAGSMRAVAVGLTLCRDLLGSNFPDAVADHVCGDRAAARLSGWVARRLAAQRGEAYGLLGWKKCYFHTRSREQVADQLQHARRFARFVAAPKQHAGALRPADFLFMPWRIVLRIVRSVRSSRAHAAGADDRLSIDRIRT